MTTGVYGDARMCIRANVIDILPITFTVRFAPRSVRRRVETLLSMRVPVGRGCLSPKIPSFAIAHGHADPRHCHGRQTARLPAGSHELRSPTHEAGGCLTCRLRGGSGASRRVRYASCRCRHVAVEPVALAACLRRARRDPVRAGQWGVKYAVALRNPPAQPKEAFSLACGNARPSIITNAISVLPVTRTRSSRSPRQRCTHSSGRSAPRSGARRNSRVQARARSA